MSTDDTRRAQIMEGAEDQSAVNSCRCTRLEQLYPQMLNSLNP